MNPIDFARLTLNDPVRAIQSLLFKMIVGHRIKSANIKTLLWDILPVRTRARHQELTILRSIYLFVSDVRTTFDRHMSGCR